MNRRLYLNARAAAQPDLNKKKLKEVIRKSIKSNREGIPAEEYNLIIVMEELSELTKEISKYLRKMGDHDGLIEEISDVLFGIEYIKEICGIDTLDIYRSMNVKLDHLEKKIREKGYYR